LYRKVRLACAEGIRDRHVRPGKRNDTGKDKGGVNGLVGYSRRNLMVPIPRFATWEAFDL
jgi:transposase